MCQPKIQNSNFWEMIYLYSTKKSETLKKIEVFETTRYQSVLQDLLFYLIPELSYIRKICRYGYLNFSNIGGFW